MRFSTQLWNLKVDGPDTRIETPTALPVPVIDPTAAPLVFADTRACGDIGFHELVKHFRNHCAQKFRIGLHEEVANFVEEWYIQLSHSVAFRLV